MEARLSAIHRGLLWLLAASLAVAILTRPAPENRRLVRALEEVSSFRAAFDQKAAEQALQQQATAQVDVALSGLENTAKHGPTVKVLPTAAPVRALASVTLATLSDVIAHTAPASTVTVGVANLEALRGSLAWRLARTQHGSVFTVSSVQLFPAEITREDVALEREVGELRLASLEARAAFEQAESRIGTLEYRVEAQAKRRSKTLFKSRLALEEARVTLQEKTQARSAVQAQYDAAAQRAERPRKLAGSLGRARVPEVAIARVRYQYGSQTSTLDIPIPLEQRKVPVPPLTGVSFTAVREAGLWDAVKDKSAAAAMAHIETRFNWHFQRVSLLGIELDGTLLLAFLPCILPLLLAMLLRRIRRAEISYSPFGPQLPRSLPWVGLKNRFLEFLVIILLPLFAVFTAAAALVLNGSVPFVPALSGIACVTLGVYAFTQVRELRDQTLSIARHSYPPPPGQQA
jgi:hypothetical protein